MATLNTISDHIFDICENAAYSNSKNCILKIIETDENFKFVIEDDGRGMDKEQINLALDPFFTTKKERVKKIGVGLPFLKYSSELTGGYFEINSKKGEGTKISCNFKKNHIDCQPIGDLSTTIFSVIYINTEINWKIIRKFKENEYNINTKKLKEIIGDINKISVMKELKEIITSSENELKEVK
ncbi:MAG: ATP-binding protein [Thermotogota bacterium]